MGLIRSVYPGAPTKAHFGGPDGRLLDVVLIEETPKQSRRSSAAVLTDGTEWYSGDITWETAPDGGVIVYGVNGYDDRSEAEEDARSRLALIPFEELSDEDKRWAAEGWLEGSQY